VADRGEHRRGGRADDLGGRVGRDQVRVGLLQPAQLDEEFVVLGVGDVRVAEHVVAVGGVSEPRPQLVDADGGVLR
jgi:hypothetical protein